MNGELEAPQRLKEVVGDRGRRRIHGIHLILFAILTGALAGVQRLAHLERMKDDAVVLKFLRMPS